MQLDRLASFSSLDRGSDHLISHTWLDLYGPLWLATSLQAIIIFNLVVNLDHCNVKALVGYSSRECAQSYPESLPPRHT